MNEIIIKLSEKGFKTFPCNLDKTPATPHGFYDARNDIKSLEKLFVRDDFLIGFPTGNFNKGIVVIDIDVNKNGDTRTVDEILEDVETNYGKLPRDTYQVQTKSGGRHFYYRTDITHATCKARFLNKTLPVDIRANNGYVVFPDEINYFTYDSDISPEDFYENCLPLPEWIANFKPAIIQADNPLAVPLPESEIREIRSALAYLSSDDRDLWVRMGMALKDTGSAAAYGLWNEWSQKSNKYDPSEMEKRWATFKPKDITIASLFHEAKKAGWITTYSKAINPEIVCITPYLQDAREPFPQHLLRPDGLVGDICDYINAIAIKPQPIFALAASLVAVGALAGRKVQTNTGIRTNIYCLCVGGPGSGKESPRKALKKLFRDVGCERKASVEDIASDASIITELKEEPSQVFLLDEIGRFLKTTGSGTKSPHLYNVVSVLMKLYSSADGKFSGKSYADKDKKQEINQPNLCLYGTTTPTTLYHEITLDQVTDGFLSRMLVFETETPRERKKKRESTIRKSPAEIIDQIKALNRKPLNMNPNGNLDHLTPDPQVVPLNDAALDILFKFDNDIEDLRDSLFEKKHKSEALYARTSQIAEQLALIVAVGVNIDNPVITEREMKFGCELARYLSDYMFYVVENFIAQNEFEHELKKVLQIIRTSGKMSQSELTRKTQSLRGYERNEILDNLIMSGQVQEMVEGSGNKQTMYYIAITEDK